jgi:predicted ATP-grasp superfamily ATP-dependent carboligase
MEAVRITQQELLEAIADASRGTAPKDARTVAELVEDTGCSVRAVRVALQKIAAARRLVAHRVQRQDISGRSVQVPAYTVTPAKRKR